MYYLLEGAKFVIFLVYDPDGEHATPEHRQVHLEYRTLVLKHFEII